MTTTTGPNALPDQVCAATAQRVRALAAAAPATPMTPAVAAAIAAIEAQHPGRVIHWPQPGGGAHVFVDAVALGGPFAQAVTWVAFYVPHTLPDGDIYPFWLRPDLSRTDGAPIGKADAQGRNFLHQNQPWLTEPAVMVSLRSTDRDPTLDSPARKLARILTTVRST